MVLEFPGKGTEAQRMSNVRHRPVAKPRGRPAAVWLQSCAFSSRSRPTPFFWRWGTWKSGRESDYTLLESSSEGGQDLKPSLVIPSWPGALHSPTQGCHPPLPLGFCPICYFYPLPLSRTIPPWLGSPGWHNLWDLCNLGLINITIIFISFDCSLLYFLPNQEYLWQNIIWEVKNM